MSDCPKLAHTICLILQSIGTVYTGELEDDCPDLSRASSLQLVIAAFSEPIPGPRELPPLLRLFRSNSSVPLLVIADQPIDRTAFGRPVRFLKYPFDAQALCDQVSILLAQAGSQVIGVSYYGSGDHC